MMVDIEPKDLIQKRTDDRGRLTLGSDYAGDEVTVLVVDVDD